MARDPGRAGCAAESRAREEALLGTASRVRRWLLVEQPGAWGRDALHESGFPRHVADHLAALALAHRARVVLIRRSARPVPEGEPRAAFLVRSEGDVAWAEQVVVDDPVELLTLDLACLASDEPPGVGAPVDEPLRLVCTNGRHDPCCADFGRPVVRALRAAGVTGFECSHIGGDRFAANLVCLPTGVYFGRVPPESAEQIVADHDAGLLALEHYRGRCHLPPFVQAAEILARLELGERRLAALSPRRWQRDGDEAVVDLDLDGGTVTIGVRRHRAAPERLTCGDATSAPWAYARTSLATAPA